ncbi:hypothetical protein [Streptomyces longispororuber]|uniref:hypothetical protein n=1 Tax=Streptomyces longispororuber TaxID=68230 RepID=UPI0036F5D651
MDRTDQPHEPGGQGTTTAGGVADAAREGAADVVHESVAQGRDLYERLREQAVDEAEAQTRRLAATLRELSTELRHMGDSAKPDSPAASLVRQLAGGGQRVADRLEHRGAGELLDDVRHFARRRPGLFLVGAALAGFAASRVGRGVSAAGSAPSHESPAPEEGTGAPAPRREVPAYAPDPALAPGEGPPPTPRLGAPAPGMPAPGAPAPGAPAPGAPAPGMPAPGMPEPPAPPPTTGRGW